MSGKIRMAVADDAAAMLDIYSPYILNSGITQETEVPSLSVFQQRIEETQRSRPWLVCEIDDKIAGYAYAGKHRDRKGYQWCTEPSVYISEKYFRFGIAKALYTALFAILKLQGYVNAYAVITLPNEQSVTFHEKFGFTYFTTFKQIGYKLGKWHDVGWWQYNVLPHSNDPGEPILINSIEQAELENIFKEASQLLKIKPPEGGLI